MSVARVLKSFPKTFWVANTIELFERWAWYGFFMLFANYLTGSSDAGGLEFTQSEKGLIMGIGTGILYFLPVVTGSIADKYGYKKVLFLSFIIYISAFILLPQLDTFTGVFIAYLYLALGAALFKPIVSATVAKTTNDENASIGFGIFYMMVNIGAFFGPLVTLLFKGSQLIFYISAAMILVNFILLLFFDEPKTTEEKKEAATYSFWNLIQTLIVSTLIFMSLFGIFLLIWLIERPLFIVRLFFPYGEQVAFRWAKLVNLMPIGESNKSVFNNTTSIFKDTKFITFLVIVSGFWTMYLQLFFTLPVFIAQWVDTSGVYAFFSEYMPFFSDNYGMANGQMEAEFITNFDAMFIIIFQIVVSSIVMRMKPLSSMMVGFLVCAIGMTLTLMTQNVMFTIGAMFIFAVGEMAGSPKITEYIGRIAPSDKKAIYMGYSFIPVFIGNVLAGLISGDVYQKISDKVEFVKVEAASLNLSIPTGLSNNAYFDTVAEKMNMNSIELTHHLWEKYHPSQIWYVIFSIGLIAVISLFLYDRFLINKDASK
ncbi:MFS transporter [Ancylomarina euxinus]|uniref:MFS transporter n=1 Tax=Ancylomarina euxinus TaxID=2283627 RepID=UPI0018CD63DB|nr:MFS transporter [Ancylomarina euxinus]MCZ4693391.1 MFS transporter [Ancylomarina euxinus]